MIESFLIHLKGSGLFLKQSKFILSAVLVGASFVAGAFHPLICYANFSAQSEYAEYLEAYGENLNGIDFNLSEDSDGNRSVRLRILGLQSMLLRDQTRTFDGINWESPSSSTSYDISGYCGLCYSSSDYNLHTVTIHQSGQVLCESDFFCIMCSSPDTTEIVKLDHVNINSANYHYYYFMPRDVSITLYDSFNYLNSAVYNTKCYYTRLISNTIPTVSGSIGDYFHPYPAQSRPGHEICGFASNFDLPLGSCPTIQPWKFYNEHILPYLEQNYPTYSQYFVFPDGYSPPEPPTVPVEQPTLPGFDFGLVEDGTVPSGAETAAYNLPEMPTKTVTVPSFDFNSINPAQIVAPVSNGLSGIWSLVTDVLQSFGLFPLVSFALLIGIIGALLLLGRH